MSITISPRMGEGLEQTEQSPSEPGDGRRCKVRHDDDLLQPCVWVIGDLESRGSGDTQGPPGQRRRPMNQRRLPGDDLQRLASCAPRGKPTGQRARGGDPDWIC